MAAAPMPFQFPSTKCIALQIVRPAVWPTRCRLQLSAKDHSTGKYCPLLEGPGNTNIVLGDLSQLRTIPDIWRFTSTKYGDRVALVDPHCKPPMNVTFKQLEQEILLFSQALRHAGIHPDEKVAIFADNSCRWLIADQGIMAMGAVNVVRGSRSSVDELSFIYSHSDSLALVVDNNELWRRLLPTFKDSSNLRFVVLLWDEKSSISEGLYPPCPVYTYEEFLDLGHHVMTTLNTPECNSALSGAFQEIQPHDVATIVYTSGTTGNPKGVMLTHANLLHQVLFLWEVVQPDPGDRFLSLLPPWHMYERSVEYFSLARGSEQVYTNIKCLKDDLKKYPPHYMVSAPLVFESLYSAVQRELSNTPSIRRFIASSLITVSMIYMNLKRINEGKYLRKAKAPSSRIGVAVECFLAGIGAVLVHPLHILARLLVYRKILSAIGIRKAGISGGGSLPSHVDKFFEAVGITLLNGYGLTESSPVVAARNAETNVLGTVGNYLSKTEIKVVDVNSGDTLAPGKRGLVKLRGPQVMKGYYKNEDATRKVVDEAGWLDTGDLGWICPEQKFGASRCCGKTLVLDGRAKDTIVLLTGENVEPTVIEEAVMQSRFIQQVMVVGQDQRRLGALVVVNKDELQSSGSLIADETQGDPTDKRLHMLIRNEIQHHSSHCAVTIGPFCILDEVFTVENGMLTPTMKVRRNVVAVKYQSQIEGLFRS